MVAGPSSVVSSRHSGFFHHVIPQNSNMRAFENDSGYPHDGRADKNLYLQDRRADKDSYPHDSNNQCIMLWLQLSFVMINVQLMLV